MEIITKIIITNKLIKYSFSFNYSFKLCFNLLYVLSKGFVSSLKEKIWIILFNSFNLYKFPVWLSLNLTTSSYPLCFLSDSEHSALWNFSKSFVVVLFVWKAFDWVWHKPLTFKFSFQYYHFSLNFTSILL